ncbi:hypothetical protein EL84_11875 [Paenibacillus sp. VT-400]|nr:hypothetical protein EL84_11875 [Paenibacillus sp. VT-400]
MKLGTDFQGRSFDQLIVFRLYLAMESEWHETSDDLIPGGVFFLFSDEVCNLDFQFTLQHLMSLFLVSQAITKKS